MAIIADYIDDGIADDEVSAVVTPYVMSHGTQAVKSLAKSRDFYENFLGLKCVQHGMTSLALRCGLRFHVICIEMGDSYPPSHLHNHWGLDVQSREEVDKAYELAVANQDRYDIQEIQKPVDQHGAYSFYLIDRDANWWEIQHYPGFMHDDLFDFGDRFTPDGQPI